MLKQLIQRLLDSRTTAAEAAHSAMPSKASLSFPSNDPDVVNITLTKDASESWANFGTYTAPADGHLEFQGRTTKEISYIQCGCIWVRPDVGTTIRGMYPLAKGNAASISGTAMKEVKAVFVKTIGAIGGGYNVFVRKVVLCLKPSFNFSQRSFCKASILTLLTSVGRVRILRRNTSQAMKEKILWLRSAAGRSLNLVPLLTTLGLGLRTLPGDPATLLTQSATVSGRPSQCKKETRSVSILGPTTQTRLPSYLFATNRLNSLLSKGGALC